MSQEVSKWLVNGLYNLLKNGVYLGYNPFTNHLLNFWDIQAGVGIAANEKRHPNES